MKQHIILNKYSRPEQYLDILKVYECHCFRQQLYLQRNYI